MRARTTIWTVAITLLSLGTLPLAAPSCSLGEGATPTCDPSLPPTDPDACHQVAACDDGQGWPKAEHGCCTEYATQTYERCSGTFADDFHTPCPTGSTDGCCQAAQNDYDLCMAGLLGGTGGSAGTGGTQATGGAGGSQATGGAGGN